MLHVNLNHPTKHQLETTFLRNFYGISVNKFVKKAHNLCEQCVTTDKLPEPIKKYTSTIETSIPGTYMAADILIDSRKKILVRVTLMLFILITIKHLPYVMPWQ